MALAARPNGPCVALCDSANVNLSSVVAGLGVRSITLATGRGKDDGGGGDDGDDGGGGEEARVAWWRTATTCLLPIVAAGEPRRRRRGRAPLLAASSLPLQWEDDRQLWRAGWAVAARARDGRGVDGTAGGGGSNRTSGDNSMPLRPPRAVAGEGLTEPDLAAALASLTAGSPRLPSPQPSLPSLSVPPTLTR